MMWGGGILPNINLSFAPLVFSRFILKDCGRGKGGSQRGALMDFCNKPKTLVISLNIVSQIYCHSEIYILGKVQGSKGIRQWPIY